MIPYRPEVKLESVDAFARHALVLERSDGLEHLRVLRLADGAEHVVAQPEPAYKLSGEAGREWDTDVARFGYSSLTSPPSSVEYDMETRQRSTVKQATVGGGYDAGNYRSERLVGRGPRRHQGADLSGVPPRPTARRLGPVPSLWLWELRVPRSTRRFPTLGSICSSAASFLPLPMCVEVASWAGPGTSRAV